MARIVGQEKWAYARVIRELLARHQEKLATHFPEMLGSMEGSNLHVALRNDLVHLIGDIHGRFQVMREHGVLLPLRVRPDEGSRAKPSRSSRSCIICGEARAVQACHIKPAKFNGASDVTNYFFLCPTHHFLFDHTRLSREEFERLSVEDKAIDAADFFNLVYRPAMEMHWRYGTYRFRGCLTCGGQDFDYVASRVLYGAGVGLQCRSCHAVVSPWDPSSPMHQAAVQREGIDSMTFVRMDEREREAMYSECEAEVTAWISANLQSVPSTGTRVKPIEFSWL